MNPESYMQRAIQLAGLGLGAVSPNPMVGAVIVHQNRIIGEGYHRRYGEAHAEVNAIQSVLDKYPTAAQLLSESTIYVSLEPCSHQGKTPPCADLIIKNGIPRVEVACLDPYSEVSGRGVQKLKQAGIEVRVGLLEKEAMVMNRRFITRQTLQRPYLILKWAQSLNGYFAPSNGSQQWLTGSPAKQLVHKWRTEEDAILIGTKTALIDNPQLTAREWPGRNPVRVVIDRELKIPKNQLLFDASAKTVIYNESKDAVEENIHYQTLEFDHYLPQFILYQLHLQDIQSVIIEGGANLLNQFIHYGLWDETRIFHSSTMISEGIPAPLISGNHVSEEMIGQDRLVIINHQLAIR